MGKINIGYMTAFPEWYRTELGHAITHVVYALTMYNSELSTYSQIVVGQMMKRRRKTDDDSIMTAIVRDLHKKNSKCAKKAKEFRKQPRYQSETWDICPECHEHSQGVKGYKPKSTREQYEDQFEVFHELEDDIAETTNVNQAKPKMEVFADFLDDIGDKQWHEIREMDDDEFQDWFEDAT